MSPNDLNNNGRGSRVPDKKKLQLLWLPFVVFPIIVIIIAASIPFFMFLGSKLPDTNLTCFGNWLGDTDEEDDIPVGNDTDLPETKNDIETTNAPETTIAPETTKVPEIIKLPEVEVTSEFIRTASTVTIWSAINSKYAILVDLSDNTVVAQKNATSKMYPASMTKIMTLIVAYENAYSLDDTFVMTEEIIAPLGPANASVAGFVVGEKLTVRDMLYGAMLPSGADATGGLAVHIAGSEENFVALMNNKAKELGLENTHFVNASGLHDDNHYSTAEEIAIIFKYALSIPECRKILTSRSYTMAPTPEHPDGLLMGSTVFAPFTGESTPIGATILGGKTGYTLEAHQCLASLAVSNNGTECILVTGSAETKTARTQDTVYMHTKYTAKQ